MALPEPLLGFVLSREPAPPASRRAAPRAEGQGLPGRSSGKKFDWRRDLTGSACLVGYLQSRARRTRRSQRPRARAPATWARAEEAGTTARKKKAMILMSDTGGGHRSSALALAAALEEQFPVEVTIRDAWMTTPIWPFSSADVVYRWMATHRWIWSIVWYSTQLPFIAWVILKWQNASVLRGMMKAIKEGDPDVVISVHPGIQESTTSALKMLGRRNGSNRIPFVTVVVDLGSAHPMWFHPEADQVIVPSDPVREIARRCRVPESVIEQHGLLLRQPFWSAEPRSRLEVRQALGIDQLKTVLVVGGGDGVGRLFQVAEAVGQKLGSLGEVQLVVVCGRNKVVHEQLKAVHWPLPVRAHILGFVDNMDEWMAAADVIVTKAGPGTIAEACTRKLPIMLSSFLPGQERGNVSLVVDGGFGAFSTKPQVIASTVTDWLQDDAALERMSTLAGEHGHPDATREVARAIGQKWL